MKKIIEPLSSEQLYSQCDPTIFHFSDTKSLVHDDVILGQERAVEAVNFALGVPSEGYNIYAMGIPSTRREAMIRHLIGDMAKARPVPSDWCYLNNFKNPNKPKALAFPAGEGGNFRADMHLLLEDLRNTIPAAFESNEYQVRRQIVEQKTQEKQGNAINEIRRHANEQNVELITTPSGFTFAPKVDGETITQEVFLSLSDEERAEIESKISALQQELSQTARQFPLWQRELYREIRALDQEVASSTVENLVMEVMHNYGEISGVKDYLEAYQKDVIENVRDFFVGQDGGHGVGGVVSGSPGGGAGEVDFSRYKVNLLVAQDKENGAPIVYVDNPSVEYLLGRVEHLSQYGSLTTDLTLIKSGALHRAFGGYLIVDVEKVFSKPFAWDALKRCLISKEIKIESLERNFGFAVTALLEPEPIPMDVKIILLGSQRIYYMLSDLDPDFSELFRVLADFEDQIERTPEHCNHYAQLIAMIAKREKLKPFTREAVAKIIDYASRLSGDSMKISLDRDALRDLMIEANYQAGQDASPLISDEIIYKALASKRRRGGKIKQRYYRQIVEETIFIDTVGERVGQINGLAVISLGEYSFGKPSRITARVRIGTGDILDIERQVELGGALHSKGVLILSSYLASKYSKERPLSLSASLVFEQSYSGVDGDSASSTELYALLSALANAPIKQSLAVTGSVNQFGEVQAIGGVNEKIEGFFDICEARGLTGEQGVVIPKANVKNIMLRKDIVQHIEDKRFSIYAVSTIDEGIEVLTGVEAGEADCQGVFPAGSINARVADQLSQFFEIKNKLQKLGGADENHNNEEKA